MTVSIGYLASLPEFLSWFATALAMTGVFMLAYAQVTRWRKVRLVPAGNAAAALSFAGTLSARRLLGPGLRERMERGDLATGIVVAGLGLACGLPKAATMPPNGILTTGGS